MTSKHHQALHTSAQLVVDELKSTFGMKKVFHGLHRPLNS